MRKMIGIRFGDNDFQNSIRKFLLNIISKLEFEPTKEQVVILFNETIYGCYLAFQNRFEYNICNEIHLKDTYLKITLNDVYIDTEVTDYITNNPGQDNLYWWDGYDVYSN